MLTQIIIVTAGRSIDELKETMKKLMKAAQVMGFTINMQTTKYMERTKTKKLILKC